MKKLLLLLFLCAVTNWSLGQSSGSLDLTFSPGDLGFRIGDGPNSFVYRTELQTDGKIIIAGSFNSYNGTARNYIARLNSDGSLDSTFNIGTGANNIIRSINLQTDGKIIVGGNFTTFNGTAINRIVRLNSDGTIDVTFNPGTGPNGFITSSMLQPDGKIIIVGGFNSYNGTAINSIARLNSDGTLDSSFNPGTGVGSSTISTLALQPNGKILIGGIFSSYNGTTINCLARVNSNGTFDATFNLGTALNGSVETISIQPDGKIIIGGGFTTFNGTSRNNIARLSSIGALDLTFNPGTGANATIRSSLIQPDGKIIVGGDFTTFNGSAINNINRLSSTGTSDATFVTGNGANGTIRSFSLQADGKIIMGGDFTAYKGLAGTYISRIDSVGSMDLTFNPSTGVNGTVYSTIIQPDGKILIGGNFSGYNGRARSNVARINNDGTTDNTFNSTNPTDLSVYCMALQSNGRIMIGGDFTTSNGFSRNRIARITINGYYDASFNPGTGANGRVYAIAIQTDGKIIIGGAFTSFNGTTVNRIVRLNSNGSIDASFNPGTGANGDIRTITLQPDGKIIIGGAFSSFNGGGVNFITRLNTDGTGDPLYISPTSAVPSTVYSTNLQPDGKIIIGGTNFIRRLNIDGTLDNTFNTGITPPNGIVYTSAVQSNGKIIYGGSHTSPNNRITRLNSTGSVDTLFNSGYGANFGIYTISLQSDEKIIIGGDFTSYDSVGRNRIARINNCLNSPNTIITQSACSSYTLNGQTYTSSGTYNQVRTNATGCDSTITLNLTIRQPSSSTLTQSVCSSYTLNGQTYSNSGTYTQIRTNAAGCDSIITLDLILLQPSSSTLTQSACSSFSLNGQTFTQSGTFSQTLTNAAGCDSTITLNLNISTPPTDSVSISGNTLTAIATGASFQWLDCNNNLSPVSGATAQSYQPTASGSYAVNITDGACSVTSNCTNLTIVATELLNNQFLISPNPTHDQITISASANYIGTNYRIFDYTGKLLQSNTILSENTTISLSDLPSGLYLLRIEGNNYESYKIVKL
jgi:uncharacterized delta-60 repeat protein